MSTDVIHSPAFGCVNSTIRLRSGRYFDLADPRPDQFTLEDIAGALAKICRFGGQTPKFYSVAEHSYLCFLTAQSDGLDPDACKAVLLHDAAEAFCGDVVKPLKLLLPEYSVIEKRIERCIADAFAVDFEVHAAVIREIDHAMLIAERKAIFGADGVKWFGEDEVRQLSPMFRFRGPEIAEMFFLAAAAEAERDCLGLEVDAHV